MTENVFRITLHATPLEIDLDGGQVNIFGIPSVSFWLNPSFYRMLAPLVEEVGVELARLLIAYESSVGATEDYRTVISQLGPTFREGFLAWAREVRVVGWGAFELPVFDVEQKRAVVRVRNAWEQKAHAGMAVRWGSPFLQGKIIGIFRHAFGANCWADERVIDEDAHIVEFSIHPSEMTIAGEIERLRLRAQERKQTERIELEKQLQEKQQTVLQLSTPVVRLWEGILLLPLVGRIDGYRAAQLMQSVLEAIPVNRATAVIIDITGVPLVDANVADSLVKTIQAARLLGVGCVLVGISPDVAQMLVRLETDLTQIQTFSTLESGLSWALGRQDYAIVRAGQRLSR